MCRFRTKNGDMFRARLPTIAVGKPASACRKTTGRRPEMHRKEKTTDKIRRFFQLPMITNDGNRMNNQALPLSAFASFSPFMVLMILSRASKNAFMILSTSSIDMSCTSLYFYIRSIIVAYLKSNYNRKSRESEKFKYTQHFCKNSENPLFFGKDFTAKRPFCQRDFNNCRPDRRIFPPTVHRPRCPPPAGKACSPCDGSGRSSPTPAPR